MFPFPPELNEIGDDDTSKVKRKMKHGRGSYGSGSCSHDLSFLFPSLWREGRVRSSRSPFALRPSPLHLHLACLPFIPCLPRSPLVPRSLPLTWQPFLSFPRGEKSLQGNSIFTNGHARPSLTCLWLP